MIPQTNEIQTGTVTKLESNIFVVFERFLKSNQPTTALIPNDMNMED